MENPFEGHDHKRCIAHSLAAFEQDCVARGLRLTPIRRDALRILLERHRAMGAYDLLEHLRELGHGAQPPVAYRALDFLVENGFVHRIHRLNAFIACVHLEGGHAPGFLICRGCNRVAEAPQGAQSALKQAAARAGFHIERTTLEALGLCPACQEAS